MQPPPPATPPQWSADGRWWWDGTRWISRAEVSGPPTPSDWTPPPGYAMQPASQMPPPIDLKPSPGLRVVLLTALAIATLITGLSSVFWIINLASGYHSIGNIEFDAIFFGLFAAVTLALVGVAIRARWARWVAIVVGVAFTLTCCGSVLGIPIIVTAARTPDLNRAT